MFVLHRTSYNPINGVRTFQRMFDRGSELPTVQRMFDILYIQAIWYMYVHTCIYIYILVI